MLKDHQAELQAQGVELNEGLVARLLERVKEDRAKMIESGNAARTIDEHYKSMAGLGIGEEQLVRLALKMNAEDKVAG